MTAWERYWFGPVAAIRPYLAMKVVLFLLAFDVWTHRVAFGWRYGTDGFNVAHFGWLDALQPLPTPPIYVGLMLCVGLLALVCALSDPGRWARALLALAFTYGWAMSLLNNYQHHYFLSLVLAAFVCFPRGRGVDLYPVARPGAGSDRTGVALAAGRPELSAWAYALLGATVAIVYAFTALTKVDAEWQTGLLIRRLAAPSLVTMASWAEHLGLSPQAFWSAQSLGVLVAECTIAVGYVLAPWLDRHPRAWLRLAALLACLVAIGFHAGASVLLGLDIGWFSYYMIGLACVYLLPNSWLWRAGALLVGPASSLASRWSTAAGHARGTTGARARGVPLIGAGVLAVGSVAAGFALDLPGGIAVGLLAALVLVAVALLSLSLGRLPEAWPHLLATGVAALLMWVTVAQSNVRFDHYSQLARFLRARDDATGALEALERAARYLPRPP